MPSPRRHSAGIVHRDLKPQNIVLTDAGIELLDFGLAAFIEPAVTSTDGTRRRVLVGSARYMAPEQVRGDAVDARSDLFSAGVVLQQMLTGARAFDRPTLLATLHAILHEPPAPVDERVPAAARAIVERCLEKEPVRRFQNAEALAAALRSAGDAMRTDKAFVESSGACDSPRS